MLMSSFATVVPVLSRPTVEQTSHTKEIVRTDDSNLDVNIDVCEKR
jgi:hypothetical protein